MATLRESLARLAALEAKATAAHTHATYSEEECEACEAYSLLHTESRNALKRILEFAEAAGRALRDDERCRDCRSSQICDRCAALALLDAEVPE